MKRPPPRPDRHPGLIAYVELLRAWAPRLDLISPGDLDRVWRRHIEDSLRLGPLLDAAPSGPAADVGSGAGFPGVVLAIAGPPRQWRLIEPRRRRAAWLEEVVRLLDLDCEVVVAPAAAAATRADLAEAHAVAVARALAPPVAAFAALRPLVAPGGVAAVFVGQGAKLPAEAGLWQPGIATIPATVPNP